MRGDEPLAVVADERQQVAPLIGGQVDFANAEEEDRVEEIEVVRQELLACRNAGSDRERDGLFRDQLGIGPDVHVVRPGLVAHALEDRERMRDDFVLIPVPHVSPREHVLA